jgi:DNA-binding XRE family transcriptional regulator
MRNATITKTQLPVIRQNLGMTIAEMAKNLGMKDGTYYYYETRFTGDALPDEISDRIVKLARKNGARIPRPSTVAAKRQNGANWNHANASRANGTGRNANGTHNRSEESMGRAARRPKLIRAVRDAIASLRKLEAALAAG